MAQQMGISLVSLQPLGLGELRRQQAITIKARTWTFQGHYEPYLDWSTSGGPAPRWADHGEINISLYHCDYCILRC